MKKLEYTVSFNTPAFLGNAEQTGQWRTPPFKALLRQWWRVVRANEMLGEPRTSPARLHQSLREEEGLLFGNAWLKHANGKPRFCKSRVSIRLDSWGEGRLRAEQWPGGSVETVQTTRGGTGRGVRSDLYLGFGPVSLQKTLSHPPAMRPEKDTAKLRLAGDVDARVGTAIQLIHWFGATGGRARNGWGSLRFSAVQGTAKLDPFPGKESGILKCVCRPLKDCLALDWPHAIGVDIDGRPLIWRTSVKENWRAVISALAHLKVGIRSTTKAFPRSRGGLGGPHLLGYPAGRDWQLAQLGNDARLASQLRFKVLAVEGGLVGLVFHLPCCFPDKLRADLRRDDQQWLDRHEHEVWGAVHDFLDGPSCRDRTYRLGNDA